jgi:hypothetical protein
MDVAVESAVIVRSISLLLTAVALTTGSEGPVVALAEALDEPLLLLVFTV